MKLPSVNKPTPLDGQIDAVLKKMQALGVDHEEYPKMLSQLERLYALKAKAKPTRVSRDTLALVLGNLFGVILIVAYEQKHVMTSKALNQLNRPPLPK